MSRMRSRKPSRQHNLKRQVQEVATHCKRSIILKTTSIQCRSRKFHERRRRPHLRRSLRSRFHSLQRIKTLPSQQKHRQARKSVIRTLRRRKNKTYRRLKNSRLCRHLSLIPLSHHYQTLGSIQGLPSPNHSPRCSNPRIRSSSKQLMQRRRQKIHSRRHLPTNLRLNLLL